MDPDLEDVKVVWRCSRSHVVEHYWAGGQYRLGSGRVAASGNHDDRSDDGSVARICTRGGGARGDDAVDVVDSDLAKRPLVVVVRSLRRRPLVLQIYVRSGHRVSDSTDGDSRRHF